MIKIDKKEVEWLISRGAKWGEDIHRTYSKHKTYYLTESKLNMKLLKELRRC